MNQPAQKTNADYITASRDRRERLGLERKEVWCHPDDWEQVKRLATRLERKRTKA